MKVAQHFSAGLALALERPVPSGTIDEGFAGLAPKGDYFNRL
jgi:hypothetical protein